MILNTFFSYVLDVVIYTFYLSLICKLQNYFLLFNLSNPHVTQHTHTYVDKGISDDRIV